MVSKSQQLRQLNRAASECGPLDGTGRANDPSRGLWREEGSHQAEDRCSAAAASDPHTAVSPKLVPRKLGPVKLIRQIGRGGMGVVWLGWHELLRTTVAVKFILTTQATPDAECQERERFLDGARVAASIRHPGLTRVLHADIVNQIPYLVMEYISGRTIARVEYECGGFDRATALSILDASAEIVAHLHQHDVIHGDIKPGNLLLDRAGELYLTDFGLACRPDSAPTFIAGTPAYMAPEMFDGTINPRTDVYALGIMAYELLTGRPPFGGDRDELRASHHFSPLPRGPLLRRGVPEHVIQFIERATNRNPLFRIRTAEQLLSIMRRELAGCYEPSVKRERLFALLGRRDERAGRAAVGAYGEPSVRERSNLTSASRALERSSPADDPAPMTPLTDMASRKRSERGQRMPTEWFLTQAANPALNQATAVCCFLCGRCGRMTLAPQGERICERCGSVMQGPGSDLRRRVRRGGSVGNGRRATKSRGTFARWIELLRMPLW